VTPSKKTESISELPKYKGDLSRSSVVLQLPLSTLNTTPTPTASVSKIKLYSIKVKELPEMPSLGSPGHFTLSRHPSTWYSAIIDKRLPYSGVSSVRAIFYSIERALQTHGNKGMLQVILWANVFNTSKVDFWKDVEQAALARLPKQDFLVLVTGWMNSIKGRAGPRLAGKYDLEMFFKENSCYFAVKQSTGFTWMSHMEAKVFQFGKDVEKG
jgi:hypothetical protein